MRNKKPSAKLTFIHTPKTGGTCIVKILKHLRIRPNEMIYHHRAPKNTKNITFTVIRDPISRLKSLLNYRLGNDPIPINARHDWPARLRYIRERRTINLNKTVSLFKDRELVNFHPFKTLTYWTKNVDILITIDQLKQFLHFFGYNYNSSKFDKKNVSPKTRGDFSIATRNRIKRLYNKDVILYNNFLQHKI